MGRVVPVNAKDVIVSGFDDWSEQYLQWLGMNCEHCQSRIESSQPFVYQGWRFCCDCMLMFTSWLMDGGTELPDGDGEIFAYVLEEVDG